MAVSGEIAEIIEKTPFVDTHEHLWEESSRLKAAAEGTWRDIGVLFWHYADSDLLVAGMPREDLARVHGNEIGSAEKWRLVKPYYERARNTGYLRNARESARMLFGADDISDETHQAISHGIAALIKPGYYRHVLREVANIEYAQVNSLQARHLLFMETGQPDLLCQDMGFNSLSSNVSAAAVEEISGWAGIEVRDLDSWHEVIDWCFATYGPRAIALKNQAAYGRKLDYAQVKKEDAAPLFAKLVRDEKSLAPEEHKAVADHCFHYCVEKAAEYGLPVKLHTGYYAGTGGMPLHRVRHNAGDMCELLKAHPDTNFIIMHITYPYQDEAIAVAKHYPNAYVDMCWAWIMNPVACTRFVKEFLMSAPANKLLTFGGDYMPVEMVPGHAKIARKGLGQAITELVEDGWVDPRRVESLIERLMRGNAHELFDYEGTVENWR